MNRQDDFDKPSARQHYRKKGTTPMVPWYPGMDTSSVSIGEADKAEGSPKFGDMIASNPAKPGDRWLVAEAYFREHYEPAE